jgi:hypothetical protein
MRKSIIVATLAIAAAAALTAAAQTGQVVTGQAPGVVGAARTVKATATITAIDQASRAVTLKTAQGKELTVIAGPDVKNFAQLKVGDNVDVQYAEALVVELKKGGGAPVARTEQKGMATAKPGAAPGAVAGRQVTIVGDVIAVDSANQSVTVRGPQRTVDITIRDPEQFKLIAKGDQLEATYTEAVAVSVSRKQ